MLTTITISKRRFLLLTILMIITSSILNARDKKSWVTFNVGLTHPVVKFPDGYKHNFTINPEFEIFLNSSIFKTSKLQTGIGIQYGEYNKLEDVSYLTWVEGLGRVPYQNTYRWKLNFTSFLIPVRVETQINNSFLDSYSIGADFGWFLKYNLLEHQTPDVSHIKINRYFLDWNLGLKKEILKSPIINLGVSSFIGVRTYLTNNNSWQKNYFFYQLILSIDLKK